MFGNTISFANIVNDTGSLVLTDDLEIGALPCHGRLFRSCVINPPTQGQRRCDPGQAWRGSHRTLRL
jgi:hypothetical protein